jgi:hypothetical protein
MSWYNKQLRSTYGMNTTGMYISTAIEAGVEPISATPLLPSKVCSNKNRCPSLRAPYTPQLTGAYEVSYVRTPQLASAKVVQ